MGNILDDMVSLCMAILCIVITEIIDIYKANRQFTVFFLCLFYHLLNPECNRLFVHYTGHRIFFCFLFQGLLLFPALHLGFHDTL